MARPVSEQCQSCITTLKKIVSILSASKNQEGQVHHDQVNNELERLCLWAGNIRALYVPESPLSLESRLQEASDILIHVKEMLANFQEAAEALLEIISGNREGNITTVTDEVGDELEQIEEIEIFEELGSCITRLFRVSSLIRQASPTDLFTKALSRSRYRFNDQFDIARVGEKYPKLAEAERVWLRERLSRAITQRRHYLSYIQDHRDKLEDAYRNSTRVEPTLKVPEMQLGALQKISDSSSRPSAFFTKASSLIPGQIKPEMLTAEDESDPEDDKKSYTTIFHSIDGGLDQSMSNRIPMLKELQSGSKKEIECPFCFRTKKFKNERQWRLHVFSDLRPYICTFPNCDAPYFSNVNEWFRHEMELHRVNYNCRLCQHKPYQDRERYLGHIRKHHPEIFIVGEEQSLLDIGRTAVEQIPAQECPCCTEWSDRLKQRNAIPLDAPDHILSVIPTIFKRHLASHLEQLALLSVPIGPTAESDEISNMATKDVALISGAEDLPALSFNSSREPSITSRAQLSDTSPQQAEGESSNTGLKLAEVDSSDNGPGLVETLLNVAGNTENGREVMKALLDQHANEVQVTEALLVAAARNTRNGGEVMELLFDRKGGEIQITKRVIMAAEENDETAESISSLLRRRVEETQITEEALLYTDKLGWWEGAERVQRFVAEAKHRLLGPGHPDTLANMDSLSRTYEEQERLEEAGALQRQALEIRQRVLGLDHPDTLANMDSLAWTCQRQEGRECFKEAEELQKQALEIRQRVLGPDHPDTLATMNRLAWTRHGWECQDELKIRKRVLGPDHPDTLANMNRLARIVMRQGHWKEAEALETQVLEIRKRVLGLEHLDTLDSMENLAVTRSRQGCRSDALELMEQCAQARVRVLGSEHPDTQYCLLAIQRWREEEVQPKAKVES
ncbi:hypothetical protein GGR58DRAFT_496404 [Xylaria digitata]|nr:hypothetical protein GGR58DRAFT_496404 [Xylaria digitata]